MHARTLHTWIARHIAVRNVSPRLRQLSPLSDGRDPETFPRRSRPFFGIHTNPNSVSF